MNFSNMFDDLRYRKIKEYIPYLRNKYEEGVKEGRLRGLFGDD